jgi:type IV pilus assembly protein PilV
LGYNASLSMKPTSQLGLGLLEVLIGLVVLSVGLLGASTMRLQAQAAAQHAGWQHQALLSAQSLVQAMRSNPLALSQQAYTAEVGAPPAVSAAQHPCSVSACGPSQRAEHDVLAWQEDLSQRLPDGHGAIQIAQTGERRIVVMWTSPNLPSPHPCPPPWPSERSCLILEVVL